MRTMALQRVGTCVVLIHSAVAPDDREWATYLESLTQHSAPRSKILVVTQGGAPSPAQRKELAAVIDKKYGGDVPTAVMTNSQLARGVVTALGWFFPLKLRVFPLEKL